MNVLQWLYDAQVTIAGHPITWREILGNAFGFASAIGGMRRRVWAWPVGIVGNVLLFSVFIAATFEPDAQQPLFGQAGRQVFFIITSVYGWWRWQQIKSRPRRRRPGHHAALGDARRAARLPPGLGRRAAGLPVAVLRDRRRLARPALVLLVRRLDLRRLDGRDVRDGARLERLLAGLDRASTWSAYPCCGTASYYPTAILYVVYGGLVVWGFVVWLRASRRETPLPIELRPDRETTEEHV